MTGVQTCALPISVIAPQPVPALAEEKVMPVAVKPSRRLPLWSLPVAAVIVAAIAAPLLWKAQTPAIATEVVNAPQPEMAPLPTLTVALPLHQAEVIAPVKKEKPADEPVVIAAIPKDALVMDANQMKAGTTRFLNGNWRVMVDVKDPDRKSTRLNSSHRL